MANRQVLIARSIIAGIVGKGPGSGSESGGQGSPSLRVRFYSALLALLQFFALYGLPLRKVSESVFRSLREAWKFDEEEYVRSFGRQRDSEGDDGDGERGEGGMNAEEDEDDTVLNTMGDMGYSGSVSLSNLYSVKVFWSKANTQVTSPSSVHRMHAI